MLLRASKNFSKDIGSLGRIDFKKGYYAYVGSAQTSLFPRLERHFARRKKLHWHIDYLTSSKNIYIKRAIYSSANTKEFECRLSKELAELTFSSSIRSFGSSDCKHACELHLFLLESNESQPMHSIAQILRKLDLKPITYRPRALHKDIH